MIESEGDMIKKIIQNVKPLALCAVLAAGIAAISPAPLWAEAPLNETADPDTQLASLARLIREKRMNDFFSLLTTLANLDHKIKNYDPKSIEKLGQNLTNLFAQDEKVYYVDKVKDETHGYSLRKVIYMAYTSADRWIYFTFVLKRGARAWQFTRFSYSIDTIKLFPDKK